MTDQEKTFFGGMIHEMFALTHAATLAAPADAERTLNAAFETLCQRLDFENLTVDPTYAHPDYIEANLKYSVLALKFGNFLAWHKGIRFDQEPETEGSA